MNIPFKFPEDKYQRTSIRLPKEDHDLKDTLTNFVTEIDSIVEINRNEFIIKAIKHLMQTLAQCESENEVKKILKNL